MSLEIFNELHSMKENAKVTFLINSYIKENYIEKKKVKEAIERFDKSNDISADSTRDYERSQIDNLLKELGL